MADYLTTDTELTSVANAIRTKGGTSASLEYPSGFVSAIEAISTGSAVETASVTIEAVNNAAPSYVYYTDANMTVQCSTGGVVQVQMPIGSIVYCYGYDGPAMPDMGLSGVEALRVNVSVPKALYAAYEVTG